MPQTVREAMQRRGGPELSQHAGFLLAQLGRAATRRYRAALAPIGLKPRETGALLKLRLAGPISQQTLGLALDIEASNLVTLLNELEADGLITRRRDRDDRRRHVVEISERGESLVSEVERAACEVEDDFLSALSEEERSQLGALLARVAESTDVPYPAGAAGEEDC